MYNKLTSLIHNLINIIYISWGASNVTDNVTIISDPDTERSNPYVLFSEYSDVSSEDNSDLESHDLVDSGHSNFNNNISPLSLLLIMNHNSGS